MFILESLAWRNLLVFALQVIFVKEVARERRKEHYQKDSQVQQKQVTRGFNIVADGWARAFIRNKYTNNRNCDILDGHFHWQTAWMEIRIDGQTAGKSESATNNAVNTST